MFFRDIFYWSRFSNLKNWILENWLLMSLLINLPARYSKEEKLKVSLYVLFEFQMKNTLFELKSFDSTHQYFDFFSEYLFISSPVSMVSMTFLLLLL